MEPWRAAVYLPLALSVNAAISKMNTIASAMQALSNASLYAARLENDIEFSEVIPPSIESDVQNRLLLLYRNEVERRGVIIPSPAAMPYDMGGSLRAIRLGRQAAQVSGVLDAIQGLLEDTLTPWSTTHPTIFVVGGVSRGVL